METDPYKTHFEKLLEEETKSFGENPLADASRYALMNGGKRIRPLIVYYIAEALGNNKNVDHAALSVEYFHTASLIADDLPCMDDDDYRRGHKSLHKAFDESTALLSSYALITAAFEQISRVPDPTITPIALEIASKASGIHGATGGQYLDTHTTSLTTDLLHEIHYKKTVTLFQVAFTFGYLYGGGPIYNLPLLKKAAYHYGTAFQIADDLTDTHDTAPNAAHHLTAPTASSLLNTHLTHFTNTLSHLHLLTPPLQSISQQLSETKKKTLTKSVS